MPYTKIDAAAQSVSRWSGGTTTQLAIFPPDSVYADRDFLWRISSAVVELPESDFTPLPDYDRILMILQGELSLSHDGGEEYTVGALEQTAFGGESHTFSRGQVTDFNLMMRKGVCTGRVDAIRLSEDAIQAILSADYDSHLLYCVSGEAVVELAHGAELLRSSDALLITGANEKCVLRGTGTVVLAETRLTK